MGLDMWFKEDAARILASTHEAMASSMNATQPANPELAEAYRTGFVDALRSVAVAFGVGSPSQFSIPTTTSHIVEVEHQGSNHHNQSFPASSWRG